MSHRKYRETKQQPSRARSGHQISCFLVSLHFLCNTLSGHPVKELKHFKMAQNHTMLASGYLMRIQANVDDSGSSWGALTKKIQMSFVSNYCIFNCAQCRNRVHTDTIDISWARQLSRTRLISHHYRLSWLFLPGKSKTVNKSSFFSFASFFSNHTKISTISKI